MNNLIVGINLAYIRVISIIMTPFIGRSDLLRFAPFNIGESLSALFDEWLEDLGTTTYQDCISVLNLLWDILTYPFVNTTHTGTGVVWHNVNGGWLYMQSGLMTFSVMLAIFVFFWGLTKANINFDRHDSWKHMLGRVLQLVVVIILLNQTFNIVSWLQDVAGAFYEAITDNYGTPMEALISSLQNISGDTSLDGLGGVSMEALESSLGKIISFLGAIVVTIGIVKKIIDLARDCLPTILEIYVYTWFFPVGLAWLASPEGKQRFTHFMGGYLQAIFTNIMRIMCIVFLSSLASVARIGDYSIFQVAEIARSYLGGDNLIVKAVLYGQAQGIDILFVVGVMSLLMRKSETIASRVFS